MKLALEFEQEADGRWIAEILEFLGVLAYGTTKIQAGERVKALALRVIAERIEMESSFPPIDHIDFMPYKSVVSY
ncbi:MAG: type II toxin-antitoxin system HicB family antitoxin [Desulfovibrio sp.]|jgi:predicted RNase H-like HicB family nuclease|nr:type II toxin-antitoxin system HicB family antitoxin [Desulfovibrio sp.]